MFQNLAHRGASEYAPENTLPAFYKALDLGATGIETDLRRSKDGVIVLIHDERVDRTTSGQGRVADYRWDELRLLDAGGWYSSVYAGERIVTFEAFLTLFAHRNLRFALELKEDGLTAEVLALIERYAIRDRLTVTSFEYHYLARMRKLDENIELGWLLRSAIELQVIEQARQLGARQLCPKAELLTQPQVELAHAHGLQVRAWGVRNVQLMRHVLDCGCDGATINYPDVMAAALQARNYETKDVHG